MLTDRLLALLSTRKRAVSLGSILSDLNLPKQHRKCVQEHIAGLVRDGRVAQQGRRYRLADSTSVLAASLELNARGFGFARPERLAKGEKDIFIPRAGLGGASHGDRVLVRITGASRGKREGRVVRVLERGFTRLCGVYRQGSKRGYMIPDNDRIPFSVLIPRSVSKGARDGVAVLVQITSHGGEGVGPSGKVIEVLGDPDSPTVQIRMAMEQFRLPLRFPEEVVEESNALSPLTECRGSRKDLRHIYHVTIDGATARDFDDAICVQKRQGGFRLYVSIADVSHYVRPGSALDREAYKRGTSVYLPDRVIPMLPERLSNNLCSLVPDEDRPAFTVILDFDLQGNRTGITCTKSLIRSRHRLTYAAVNEMIFLRQSDADVPKKLLSMLQMTAKLTAHLAERRRRRGSLGFNIPSAQIMLANDHIDTISRSERNQAHLLVEECMLAANEAVAAFLAERNIPVLYRIHEQPDPEKVDSFTEAARSMGMNLPPTEITPAWFARVLAEAQDSPAEYVVNNLLLRTMQQARYAPENLGHFGLAARYYLHFTSPIRRYPDLVAHRVLQAALGSGSKKSGTNGPLPAKISMAEAGLFLSKRERIAIDVERNVQARLAALFLRDRLNEEFDAIISGVTSFGLFVELLEYFISGAIPVRDMEDDYYLHDSRAHRLIGERSGRTYQLGQMVRVKLDHVDMIAKRITFSLVPQQD